MNNFVNNSKNSFIYFANFLNYQLENKLKNSRIKQKTLDRLIQINENILTNESNINFLIQRQDNMEISFCLNVLQAYRLIFQESKQLLITSNSGAVISDNLISAMQFVNIAFDLKNNISLNSTKTIFENKIVNGGQSKLFKANPSFDLNIIRKEQYDLIIFDNWQLKNEKKIKDVLIELDDQNVKVILTMKHNDDKVTDLIKSLENSIIVNKIKIN